MASPEPGQGGEAPLPPNADHEGGPLFLRSVPAEAGASLAEPLPWVVAHLGKLKPQLSLREAFSALRQKHRELLPCTDVLEKSWSWAETKRKEGRFLGMSLEEVVALRCCVQSGPSFHSALGQSLYDLGTLESTRASGWNPKGAWETIIVYLASAFAKLNDARSRRWEAVSTSAPANGRTLYRVVWVPKAQWDAHIQTGRCLFFAGVQQVGTGEQWEGLLPVRPDSVACVLEFDPVAAEDAIDVAALLGAADPQPQEAPTLEAKLLPPFLRCMVRSITSVDPSSLGFAEKRALYADDTPQAPIYRVCLAGQRKLHGLPSVIEAPPEAIMVGALLVGLHTLSSSEERPSALLEFERFFNALTTAAEVKSPDEVAIMWKSYWECCLEDCRTWKEIAATARTGIIPIAKTAVLTYTAVLKGVTKRFLGFQSCVNTQAMARERELRIKQAEERMTNVGEVARTQVLSLQLETLTDPEAFINFIQHNPNLAFQAAPAATKAYAEAGPAQRVLLFAKLAGLVALAGALMRGDSDIAGAFDLPFPWKEDEWLTLLSAPDVASSAVQPEPQTKEEAARCVIQSLQRQRLLMSRTRLLVIAGAPDVGKTTILREAYALKHLRCGLSKQARTEELTFELHPDGDEDARPVYLVDSPGFGDGAELHRNDMGRLLVSAGRWLPGAITLLWVMRAGRQVRQEADSLLAGMRASSEVRLLVIVTHIDKLFEERYREAGIKWKENELKSVPSKDPRWAEKRKQFMQELEEEVSAGVEAVIGRRPITGRGPNADLAYACLGGWMSISDEDDDDDEFSEQPPWPWAREELTNAFNVLGRNDLRCWLDERVFL